MANYSEHLWGFVYRRFYVVVSEPEGKPPTSIIYTQHGLVHRRTNSAWDAKEEIDEFLAP